MSSSPVLLDVASHLTDVRFDLRYATSNNITGRPIYASSTCLLHPDALACLQRAAHHARLAGYRLLVLDAYRPQAAQERLWATLPDPRYVRDVRLGSHHTRGVAVDVTLLDDAGQPLAMGTGFDEMGPAAHPYYPDLPPQIQRNRLLLNGIMFGAGFVGIDSEWWHFELPNAASYPLLNEATLDVTP
ncbi:D-alanyl-D-alanine dipeptidase [Pseudaeromonas sp. ZJS20]|uniref:D-alanyl-D-alanine dipeptidase n=1 Tax=Pseudaeromonas aegiceratis TaxID=3153928 RepID=UPI00390CD980